MTTGFTPRLISDDSKLNQDCRVVVEDCFKLPFAKSALAQTTNVVTVSNITKRRRSIRLENKFKPCMEDVPHAVKKPKMVKSDDVKQLAATFKSPGKERPNIGAVTGNEKMDELSENDIVSACLP